MMDTVVTGTVLSIKDITNFNTFYVRWHNWVKRPLASSYFSVCLSIRNNLTLNGQILMKLVFEYSSEICRQNKASLKSDNNNGYLTCKTDLHISLSSSQNQKCTSQIMYTKSKPIFYVQYFFRKSCHL